MTGNRVHKPYYNRTNTCDKINGREKCQNKLIPKATFKEYINGVWTGKWICEKCYKLLSKYGTTDRDKILQIPGYRERSNKLYYNRTNSCERCGIKFEKKGPRQPLREYNEEGNWTGDWLCRLCYQKYSYTGQCNIMKRLADRRTGNLNPNSNQAIGDKFERVTCELFGVENLNIKYDNYEVPIDHSRHSELGIIDTVGRSYNQTERCWFLNLYRYNYKDIDNIICYCLSVDGNLIERIYIFPKKRRSGNRIYKKPAYKNTNWDVSYRVKDEDILRKANDIWKIINV